MQEHLIGASNETITTLAIYRTFVDVSQPVLTHVHSSQFNLARIAGDFFCPGERGDWSKENETLFPPPAPIPCRLSRLFARTEKKPPATQAKFRKLYRHIPFRYN